MKTLANTAAILCLFASALPAAADQTVIERGRYLIQTSGCNDCHTPGYMQADGRLPTSQWLTGSAVGFQGPWGTTYPSNLRLALRDMSEARWLQRAREPMAPPMPWFNLREFSDRDLVAIYRFIRSLGPAGEAAPSAVAPGTPVATPYIEFVPKQAAKVARQ